MAMFIGLPWRKPLEKNGSNELVHKTYVVESS